MPRLPPSRLESSGSYELDPEVDGEEILPVTEGTIRLKPTDLHEMGAAVMQDDGPDRGTVTEGTVRQRVGERSFLPAVARTKQQPERTMRLRRGDRDFVTVATRLKRSMSGNSGRVIAAVTFVVVAGGVYMALSLWQMNNLRADAVRAAKRQSFSGLTEATEHLASAVDKSDDPYLLALLAKHHSRIAFEFGEPHQEAQSLVAKLGKSGVIESRLARVYLALAADGAMERDPRLRELTEEFGDHAETSYVLAMVALRDRDPERAATLLRQSIERSPTPLAHARLGNALVLLGDVDGALASFDAALVLSPGHDWALIYRARALAERGRVVDPGAAPMAGDDEKVWRSAARVESELDGLLTVSDGYTARAQKGWIWLTRAELRSLVYDHESVREALAQAKALRPMRDWYFSEAMANVLLRMEDFSGVRVEAERVLRDFPARKEPWLWLARLALAQQQPELALKLIKREKMKGAIALAVRGEAELALRRLGPAKRHLDAAILTAPRYRPAILARARLDLAQGQSGAAIARVEAHYRHSPTADLAVVLGAAFREAGERDKAVELLRWAAKSPLGKESHLELARLFRAEKNYAEARAAYARAIEVQSSGREARLESALLAYDLGDVSGARESLAALLSEWPDHALARLHAVRVHVASGDFAGARAHFAALKQRRAPAWLVHREKGRLLLHEEKTKAARKALEKAVRISSDNAEAWLLLLRAELEAGDAKRARKVLENVMKRFAGQTTARLARAMVDLGDGRASSVVSKRGLAGRRFEDEVPRVQAVAFYHLALAQSLLGRTGKAIDTLERALNADPSNADVHVEKTRALLEQGSSDQAHAAAHQAIALQPQRADAHFLLGEAAFAQGKHAVAKKAYRKYMLLAPKGPEMREAQAKLKRLRRKR